MFSLRRNLSSHATHTYRLTVLQDHNRAAAHSKKPDPRQLGTRRLKRTVMISKNPQ
jgi:hypothetical protein